jgi:hypothetical protein
MVLWLEVRLTDWLCQLNNWSINLFIDKLITVVSTTGILSSLMILYVLHYTGIAGGGEAV